MSQLIRGSLQLGLKGGRYFSSKATDLMKAFTEVLIELGTNSPHDWPVQHLSQGTPVNSFRRREYSNTRLNSHLIPPNASSAQNMTDSGATPQPLRDLASAPASDNRAIQRFQSVIQTETRSGQKGLGGFYVALLWGAVHEVYHYNYDAKPELKSALLKQHGERIRIPQDSTTDPYFAGKVNPIPLMLAEHRNITYKTLCGLKLLNHDIRSSEVQYFLSKALIDTKGCDKLQELLELNGYEGSEGLIKWVSEEREPLQIMAQVGARVIPGVQGVARKSRRQGEEFTEDSTSQTIAIHGNDNTPVPLSPICITDFRWNEKGRIVLFKVHIKGDTEQHFTNAIKEVDETKLTPSPAPQQENATTSSSASSPAPAGSPGPEGNGGNQD